MDTHRRPNCLNIPRTGGEKMTKTNICSCTRGLSERVISTDEKDKKI
jgi:hypothetical protein